MTDPNAAIRKAALVLLDAATVVVESNDDAAGLAELNAARNSLRLLLMCQARHTFGEDLGTGRSSTCSLESDGHRRHITDEGRWWEVWSDADSMAPRLGADEFGKIVAFIRNAAGVFSTNTGIKNALAYVATEIERGGHHL